MFNLLNFFGNLVVFVFIVNLVSCVTTPVRSEYAKSKVIERMGDVDKTPDWANGSVAMTEEGQHVIFISHLSMSGNARSEACLKSAELDGKASMLKFIKDNITTSGQFTETDVTSDPGYEALTAFLSQGNISGVKTTERYYEKREESAESGDRVLKLHCAVKLAIKKSELERQLREATTKQSGNPEIRKKLLDAQKQFIENVGNQNSETKTEETSEQ